MARSVLGRGDQVRRRSLQGGAGQVRPRLHRRHHLLAHDQRGSLRRAAHGARRLRQQQRRYLRPRLPFADRLRPEADVRRIRRHAGLQERRQVRRHHGHRRQPDRRPSGVRLAHEEAPARGCPPHRRRSAPHRHRALAARRGRLPPAAAPQHQRRRAQRHDARHRHRGHDRPQLHRRALRQGRLRPLGEVHQGSEALARGDGADHRRSGRGSARRRPPVRHRRQRGHLLRPRRHRAQPGLDHGHGHGQPRHGHRQHRPRGRRREPAARPEQRAGLLRHGLVPARVPRLPPRLQRGDAQAVREGVEGRAQRRAGPAHSQHVRRSLGRHVQGPVRARRGHRPVRPQHPPRRARARVAGNPRRAGPVPQRDGGLRARVLPRHLLPREGRHLHQRRAPREPRASGDGARSRAWPSGTSSAASPPPWAIR